MREVEIADASAQITLLLDRVGRGETILLTRGGRAFARIVPETTGTPHDVQDVVSEIKASRVGTGRITVEELLSARDDGRPS